MIELGSKVKHVITGFEGIATSRTRYINGCVRYAVMAEELKDGAVNELYFDEQELMRTGDGIVAVVREQQIQPDRPGGSRNVPPPPRDPPKW
jgi:hypothetical protein